jgi:streptogramin lyase
MPRHARIRTPLLPLIIAAALAASPAAAHAAKLDGTFNVSGPPKYITKGPDGNMWATLGNNKLARIKPSGKVKEFQPAVLNNPVGISQGADGNLWLTQPNEVVKVPPDNPNGADDFTINAISDPRAIDHGPIGTMWTASGDQLINFDPANPAGFDAETISGMGARGLDVARGFAWIADFGSQRIVRAKVSGGVKTYDVGGGPQEVAGGPKGAIAYANPGDNPQTVGRIAKGGNPKTTKDKNADPFGLVFAGGSYWIAEFAKHKLGVLSTGGKLTHFDMPNNSGPRYIAKGPNNTLWVSLETSEKIAKIKLG